MEKLPKVEMAETGWHRHETWGYPMEIVPVQIETADCCKREVDPENLQESEQVVRDTILDGIFQGIKSGIQGNDFELVEHGTKSLLQAGSGGSPGGKQV